MNKDPRITAIRSWLENELHLQIRAFTPASSDASFRRYFRVSHQHGTHIIMDAPPERENTRSFVKIAEIFSNSGINVPEILHQNLHQGFLLLEDFGKLCFLDILNADNGQQLYQSALNSLLQIQRNIDIEKNPLPRYDKQLLRNELTIFEEWYLTKWLHLRLSIKTQAMLENTWSVLIDSALQQPRVCVHRDYHSRNLMHVKTDAPGIIDFQDAVIGPVTYDLVSLLRDCYISLPDTLVVQLMSEHFNNLREQLIIDCNETQFTRWFDLMGLQRHLKAIGIFSRLKLRDNKPEYLQDIPRTLKYVNKISALYPELTAFNHFLQQQLIPAINHPI